MDLAALADWQSAIGRSQRREERIEHESLRRYALAIGADPDIENRQPPLAHWAAFLPRAEDHTLGPDGATDRGGLLPPISLPRRLFAGAAIQFALPLLLGETAQLVTCIADIRHKRGRSGDLLFVEIENRISQRDESRIIERRRFVYREHAVAAAPSMPIPSTRPIEGECWEPIAAHLFRFSAATFNAHRIHYDADYARDVENYPALIVHAPLTCARLAGLASRRGALASFEFRAEAPLFLGQPIMLQMDGDDLRAVRCDGVIAISATATYR